jgi:hypothetical protein
MEQFNPALGVGSAGDFPDQDLDPELARAIEASYASRTTTGMTASEDELFAEAIRISSLEEEARKRRELGIPEDELESMLPAQNGGPSSTSGASRVAPAVRDTVPGRWQEGAELGGSDDAMAGIEADFAALAESAILGPPPARQGAASLAEDDFASNASSGFFEEGAPQQARHAQQADMVGADRERLAPGGMDAAAMEAAAVAEQADASDRELAMAIEASYNAQTETGRMVNEDDMLAEALRISQQDEDARRRADLREEQENELKESILMDQMREEEQKRRRIEEQQLQRLEAERLEEENRKKEADEEAKRKAEELKRSRIPAEPPAGEPGRVDFMIRLPNGKRMRRAFRGTDKLEQVYDYVDIEAAEALTTIVQYRLVTTMPRQVFEDRSLSLAEAGLKGQCALNVEAISQTE